MLIELMNINCDNNIINKPIVNVGECDIKIKDTLNIYNPRIILKYNDIDFNYVYIPNFNRYYYVDKISILKNDLFEIELKTDVLMSFKDDILNANADVIINTDINKYYYSGRYDSEVRKTSIKYESSKVLDVGKTIIINTMGV